MSPLATTLDQLMVNEIVRYADTIALVDADRCLTYRQWGEAAARLANILVAEGIGRGDRVAVAAEDRVEVMPAYLAGWMVGATVVHINARLAVPEIQYLVDDSAPTALVYTSGLRERVEKLSLTTTRFVAELDGDDLGARLRAAPLAPPPAMARPEDIAVIGYTSGTTGRPKGAMASHLSLTTNCRLAPFNLGVPNRVRMAYSGSVSFVASFWSMVFAGLYVGGTVRFLGHYDLDSWFETMRRDRSTWTYVPSPLMAGFAERVSADPSILGHLRSVMHTGSIGHPRDVEAVVRAVRGRYVELYGSTEVISPVAGTSPALYQGVPPGHKVFASGGIALPSAQLWIAREDGSRASVDEDGYIVARSDVGFSGYLNDREKTAATIVDGAIRTGDRGRLDADGYLFVSGRSAELIVSGGMNIYPAEVERALLEHPDIVAAAVVGLPHERWGVTVAAAVVVRAGATLTAEDVVAWSRGQLASYKKPTHVRFLDELPQNHSRKIDKRRLRALLLGDGS